MVGNGIRRVRFAVLGGAIACLLATGPAWGQWQIQTEDGSSSIKFGFLVQARAESLDSGADTAENLFFRRLRLLAGGKINDQLSFFFETDSPNLGKGTGTGGKVDEDVFIQDFVITWKPRSDAFNLDVGMLLNEVSYNSNQSAASLMTTDYGQYSFVWSGPLTARVGRDYGVRARGYLANDHVEYRASVLQGNRGAGDSNSFRFLGRVMFNVFEAQKGLFYTGTTLGARRLLNFGASYDTQEDYEAYGADVFWDQPVGGGNAVTLQADWSHLDGDVFLTSLPEQDNIHAEAGFYLASVKLLPFVQYGQRDFEAVTGNDEDKVQVGLGYMFAGHNGNLKLSYAQISPDVGDDRDEIWLNLQVFRF